MKRFLSHLPKLLVVGLLAGGLGRLAWVAFAPSAPSAMPESAAPVQAPGLSWAADAGKRVFDANCAQCHGAGAVGTDKGPPLIHRLYNPGHHADEAFFRAVRDGVRRHHWNFGDMPPQPQVSKRRVEDVVAYIREIQEANGIHWEEHRM